MRPSGYGTQWKSWHSLLLGCGLCRTAGLQGVGAEEVPDVNIVPRRGRGVSVHGCETGESVDCILDDSPNLDSGLHATT
jgi:hypothetical protein